MSMSSTLQQTLHAQQQQQQQPQPQYPLLYQSQQLIQSQTHPSAAYLAHQQQQQQQQALQAQQELQRQQQQQGRALIQPNNTPDPLKDRERRRRGRELDTRLEQALKDSSRVKHQPGDRYTPLYHEIYSLFHDDDESPYYATPLTENPIALEHYNTDLASIGDPVWGFKNHDSSEWVRFNLGEPLNDELEGLLVAERKEEMPATWHEALKKRIKWYSRFPGIVRISSPFRMMTLHFHLKPRVQTLNDFYKALESTPLQSAKDTHNILGRIGLSYPDKSMNSYLCQCHPNSAVKQVNAIIPIKIWIVQEKTNLPIPMQVQLYSMAHTDPTLQEIPWFSSEGPSPFYTDNGQYVDDRLAHYVHAGLMTNESHQLMFQADRITKTAEFQRWINTSYSQMQTILSKYTIDKDRYYSVKSPGYIKGGKANPHGDDHIQFLILEHWNDMKELSKHHGKEQKIVAHPSDATCRLFVVHESVLLHYICQKTQGIMNQDLHLMRTDKAITLELSLLDRKEHRTEMGELQQMVTNSNQEEKEREKGALVNINRSAPQQQNGHTTQSNNKDKGSIEAYFRVVILYDDHLSSIVTSK